MKKIIRILSIVFILFISLFALDVFGNNFRFIALGMHLIPTIVAIILTLVAWKKEFLGGILWIVLGVFFMIMSLESWIIYVPAMVIGGLNFGASRIVKNRDS